VLFAEEFNLNDTSEWDLMCCFRIIFLLKSFSFNKILVRINHAWPTRTFFPEYNLISLKPQRTYLNKPWNTVFSEARASLKELIYFVNFYTLFKNLLRSA
jgi:hypothetical protein